MPFEIIRNDITKVKADAIVNAANTKLKQGGGVCGAIFAAAGAHALQRECDALDGCAVGGAVITGGYDLPAKFIIHAVGPIWHGGDKNEDELLRKAYKNALNLANEYGLDSIAFPLISAGIYGFPKEQAMKAATETIQEFLLENEMFITLVVYNKTAFELGEELYRSVTNYVASNYIEDHFAEDTQSRRYECDLMAMRVDESVEPEYKISDMQYMQTPSAMPQKIDRSLDDLVKELDDTFSQMLLRLIDQKDKTDTEVYKKANIDRKLFSKIRSNKAYRPSKATALALAIALELSLDETKDLLRRAGYAISHCNKFDIIVEYFIIEGEYDIFTINETLFAFEQPLLCC